MHIERSPRHRWFHHQHCGALRSSKLHLPSSLMKPSISRRVASMSILLFTMCCTVESTGDGGAATRTPEDGIEHTPSQISHISNDRLKDSNSNLEHSEQWSQMTNDHLEISVEKKLLESNVDPSTQQSPTSEFSGSGDKPAEQQSRGLSPKISTKASPVEGASEKSSLEANGKIIDKVPPSTGPEIPLGKQSDPTVNSADLLASESADGSNSLNEAKIEKLTSSPLNQESDIKSDPVAHGQNPPGSLPEETAGPAPETSQASLESRNGRESINNKESTGIPKQSRQGEDSLFKDAVTDGNRPKSAESRGPPETTADDLSRSESATEKELRELLERARQFRTGSKTVKQDYKQAFELCEAVAAKGGLGGFNCQGEFFKHGLGRDRDLKRAAQLFQIAADKGHPAAQRNLAFLYSSGHGVDQNMALAVLHLHFAAVSGDHMAQLSMGYRHMYGVGVPKNCQTAMEFYMPAAEHVVKEIHSNRAHPMIEKQALATDGSKSKNLDLDDDVINYYAYSADRGDTSAQVALGQLHFMGARGLQQDYVEAFRWYSRAAELGDANAMGHLGNMYAQGIHVQADNQTALSYFRRGVEKGNALSLNGMGFMSMYGMGVPQSYDEAFKSFSKAAEQGNQEARFNLGALHVGGYGVPKDYAKAIYYFTLAANRGHMLALYNLAMMHHNGFGTPRSCPNAVQFIKSVAERGEWASLLQAGYKQYHNGDVDGSLLTYLELMELGFDTAQANVAHIYDEERTNFTRVQKSRALRAYELSAQQGNMAAELKIGDYYYNGWGTEVSYRKAVAHYRAASEARVAQAMFNLGWMHEQGRGVAQDRHLAKRFYDMAAEAAPEAVWPAGLCLAKLWLLNTADSFVESLDALALALNLRFGRHGLRIPMSTTWLPLVVSYWDLLLGFVLAALLLVVVAMRSYLTSLRVRRL